MATQPQDGASENPQVSVAETVCRVVVMSGFLPLRAMGCVGLCSKSLDTAFKELCVGRSMDFWGMEFITDFGEQLAYGLLMGGEKEREVILDLFADMTTLCEIENGSESFLNLSEIMALEYDMPAVFDTLRRRRHISCLDPVGVLLVLYEIAKPDESLILNSCSLSSASVLYAKHSSMHLYVSPASRNTLPRPSLAVATLPDSWKPIRNGVHDTIPRWLVEDPRAVFLLSSRAFQSEIDNNGFEGIPPPKDRLSTYNASDLCLSILSSPAGLQLYEGSHITFRKLFRISKDMQLLHHIRKVLLPISGMMLIKALGERETSEVLFDMPNIAAALASFNSTSMAEIQVLARALSNLLLALSQDRSPADFNLHPKLIKSCLATQFDLNVDGYVYLIPELDALSEIPLGYHTWIPHDYICHILGQGVRAVREQATSGVLNPIPSGAQVLSLLTSIECSKQGLQLDSRAATVCASLLILQQQPFVDDAIIDACVQANIVVLCLCAILAKENLLTSPYQRMRINAAPEPNPDGTPNPELQPNPNPQTSAAISIRTVLSEASVSCVEFVKAVMSDSDSLAAVKAAAAGGKSDLDYAFVYCPIKLYEGVTSLDQFSAHPKLQESVAAVLQFVVSPISENVLEDVLANPSSLITAVQVLKNPIAFKGLNTNPPLWDLEFLQNVKLNVTDAMLEALSSGTLSKDDIVKLPKGIFGTVDEAYHAVKDGFITKSAEEKTRGSLHALLEVLATYRDDDMTKEEIERMRKKQEEKTSIIKLKLLFRRNGDEFGWRTLHSMGIDYGACEGMSLASVQLLLAKPVRAFLTQNTRARWEDIADMPEELSTSFIFEPQKLNCLFAEWFPLQNTRNWAPSDTACALELLKSTQEMTLLLRQLVVGGLCSFEELMKLGEDSIRHLAKYHADRVPILQRVVQVSQLALIRGQDMKLVDVLYNLLRHQIITRAANCGDWPSLFEACQNKDVQALLRRDTMILTSPLLYHTAHPSGGRAKIERVWGGDDLPFLARLKDSDQNTVTNVCNLILEGSLSQSTFRRIVVCSPAWFMHLSYHTHRLNLIQPEDVEAFHRRVPSIDGIIGYLDFLLMARTINELNGTYGGSLPRDQVLRESVNPSTFEFFTFNFMSTLPQDVALGFLLGRYADALETEFITWHYFVYQKCENALLATGNLSRLLDSKRRAEFTNLVREGIVAAHIVPEASSSSLRLDMKSWLPVWKDRASKDPLGLKFLSAPDNPRPNPNPSPNPDRDSTCASDATPDVTAGELKSSESKTDTQTETPLADRKTVAPPIFAFGPSVQSTGAPKISFGASNKSETSKGFVFNSGAGTSVDSETSKAAAERRRKAKANKL